MLQRPVLGAPAARLSSHFKQRTPHKTTTATMFDPNTEI
jgi:hypothetical protein